MNRDYIVVMLSTDNAILKEGSAVRARMGEYAKLCKELHIVLLSTDRNAESVIALSSDAFIYPTKSSSKWSALFNAYRVGAEILMKLRGYEHGRVLVTTQDPFETGFIGKELARRFKTKLHVQVHTDFLSPYFARTSLLNRIRISIAGVVLPQAHRVRTVSEKIKRSIIDRYCISAHGVSVLPIFVDGRTITSAPASPVLHDRYPAFKKVILMASRFVAEKDFRTALKAFREVVEQIPDAGLVIVGKGPLQKKLEHMIVEYGLQGKAVIEPWANDLVTYYKSADVFLSTSRYEGYGLTLMESFLAGTPMVTTDVGIAADLRTLSPHVHVCEVGDIEGVSKALIETCSSSRPRAIEVGHIPSSLLAQSKDEYLSEYGADWRASFEDKL